MPVRRAIAARLVIVEAARLEWADGLFWLMSINRSDADAVQSRRLGNATGSSEVLQVAVQWYLSQYPARDHWVDAEGLMVWGPDFAVANELVLDGKLEIGPSSR